MLPDNGAAWPPPQWAPLYSEMRIDDAWYSGDRKRLAKLYRDQPKRDDGRRRLWGRHRQHDHGRHDNRLHIPLPADIATTSADLLFSEPPTFTVPDDKAAQARLDELVADDGVANSLLEAAEVGAALGGVYLRGTWDRSLVARPLLTVVHCDVALPEFRFGVLVAASFWRELSTAGAVLRHVERHERGRIEHALYQGTVDNIGRRVPLTEHPETARLVESLGADGDSIATGIDRLTVGYVPNIRPNRRHRGSPLGRSDYQSAHDMFDGLDEVWTSWMRDIRLARARLIVPADYLRDHGPGRGASFDEDREIWQTLNIPPTEQGSGITLSQFAIRVAEHQSTADALVRQAVGSAGYSAQSFGLGDSVAITATEVGARERRSMITRDKKSRYWAPVIADMLHVVLLLDRALGFSNVTPLRPRVRFGDSVSEDPQTTAQTLALLMQAQAASIDTRVRILHPDWPDERVRVEVDRILVETGQAVPDPMQLGDVA
ncbi:phage capsid protein [Embleya sp. MST-111070]|uniref:phage capsid protein n=1 Tax=Embleya sp. MST-111070 TaxID=3398231 RepID=UPI003F737F2D